MQLKYTTYTELQVGADLLVDASLRVAVVSLDDLRLVETSQDVHQTASVPVVRHTTSVVNVAGCVHQDLEGELIQLGGA